MADLLERRITSTTPFVQLTSSTGNTTNSCYGPIENGPSCENIKHGYYGVVGKILSLIISSAL